MMLCDLCKFMNPFSARFCDVTIPFPPSEILSVFYAYCTLDGQTLLGTNPSFGEHTLIDGNDKREGI